MFTEKSETTTSFDEKINSLLKTGISTNKPVAIWRIGGKNQITAICQLSNKQDDIKSIESSVPGFIIAPFEKSNNQKFIVADLVITSTENELRLSPTFSDSNLYEEFRAVSEQVRKSENFNYTGSFSKPSTYHKSKTEYMDLVQKSIDEINSGAYQKIVPSRCKEIKLRPGFNPLDEFNKLCKAYPNAFVSLVYLPKEGIWLGATPELLISIDKEKIFRTVALAGTQAVPTDFELSKAAWMQKDIEEQALVSRYIINCFKKIRLREFNEYGPKTTRAANLIHLKTAFEVNMKEVNFPLLGSVMLDLLHPTSAVCGMPMEESARFLKENEGYDRDYYSGYFGPVNISDETNIFVNLRCMKIMKNHAILFAGGGVTEDSEPESEWKETEMKLKTLLDVIQ